MRWRTASSGGRSSGGWSRSTVSIRAITPAMRTARWTIVRTAADPGMVLKVEPLRDALRAARAALPAGSRRVYLGADGSQVRAGQGARGARLAGLDPGGGPLRGCRRALHRVEIDEQWSIGDYVLTGGELPALVVIDAIARLLPGSARQRRVGGAGVVQRRAGRLAALYAARARCDGHAVPEVLASGDHAAIRRWRLQQALGRTWLRRPELLERRGMNGEERALLEEFKRATRAASKDVRSHDDCHDEGDSYEQDHSRIER